MKWALLAVFMALSASAAERKTKNVFLITTDGLRWEEVFNGADQTMFTKEYGNITKTNEVRAAWWRESVEERRKILMPFLWSEVAAKGQLWGNRQKKSDVRVTNGHNFSYPGYNEFLTGIPDPRIDSNDKKLNLNTNVFEFLQTRPGFDGRVAAVINWGVLPWILNGPRSRIPIWTPFEAPDGTKPLQVPELINEMSERSKTIWTDVILDTFVSAVAKHTVKTMKPRAMYIQFGETDDWAHEGAYERYLKAAHEFDRFIGELWKLTQSMPEYRDSTAFVIATDHGRGPAPVAWKNHGASVTESAYMWFAVMGPDVLPRGERADTALVTQSQIASTVAALVGHDFKSASPKSAPAIKEIVAP